MTGYKCGIVHTVEHRLSCEHHTSYPRCWIKKLKYIIKYCYEMLIVCRIHFCPHWFSCMTTEFMVTLSGRVPSPVWVREISSEFSMLLLSSYRERWVEVWDTPCWISYIPEKHCLPANIFYNIASSGRDTNIFLFVYIKHLESTLNTPCTFQH